MAQYWEAWSGSSLGGDPTGWTKRFSHTTTTYEVREDAAGPAGRALRITKTGSAQRSLLSLDAVDSDADRAKVKIRALVRLVSDDSTSTAVTFSGIAGRGAGAASTESMLVSAVGKATGFTLNTWSQVRALSYSSGTLSTTLSDSPTFESGELYWLGLDLDGTSVTATIAAQATPETIIKTASRTTGVTAAGWVGLFSFSGATVTSFDVFCVAVATGETPAFYSEPSAGGAEVSFSGTVPAQSFVEDSAITPLNLATYFSGDLTPFSYAVTTGTLPAGLSLNSSTGVISGTPTTPASAVSIVVTATDDESNTAATNAFNITITEASVAMTLVTDIDAGNVSQGSTTITGADTSTPTVNIVARADAGDWRHLFFAVENAEGKSPIFKAPRSSRYNNPTPDTEYRPVWTQDFITWTRAPSRSLVGGTTGTIDWQFTDPLPSGRVYVATQPLGRQADAVALTTRLLTDYPSVISPAASSDSGGVFFTSPAETDGIGRAAGGHPLYGLKARFGGSTTDGGPKRKLVVISGIHAAGEQTCWIAFVRFLNFVLDSSDAAAVAVRANWDIDLYYNITPNGVYSGHNRTNPSRTGDPNRIWDAPNVEIAATQAAILNEIDGGRFDAFFSWHGFSSETKPFLMYLTSAEYNAGTRSALTQAFIDEGTTLFGVSPTLETSGTNNTDVWWALTNGAAVAIDTEVQQNGSTAPETYQHIGESWAKTLQAVDAAGEFWAPSETAAGEVAALSLSAPASTAAASTSASGTPQTLSLSAPAGDATTASTTFASGDLAALGLTAPNGTSAARAAVSAGIQALSITAPAGDASSASTTFASGDVAPISLAAPVGTTAQSTASSGAIQPISLTAPNGNASTGAEMIAAGDIAPIGISAADGATLALTNAAGAIRHLTISALAGTANDGSAPAFDLRGSVFARIPARHGAFARIAAWSDVFARIQ